MNFRFMTLEEAGVQLIDCVHKTPAAQETGFPYIAIPQLTEGHINFTDARRISAEDFEKWTIKAKPKKHDIVLSRRCNPGVTAYVSDDTPFALGQNLVLLRPVGPRVYPDFLRWLARSPFWWDQVDKFINVGAVFESLKCAEITKFELPFPSLVEQQLISEILSPLDDKINLNRKLNETLEQISRALFQSWFVDFEPVKAKLAAKRHGRDPERACMAALSGKLRIAAGKPRAERLDDQLPAADELDAAIAALDTLTEAQRQQLAQTAAHFPSDFQESELGLIPTGWDTKQFSEIFEINPRRALRKNTIAPYLDMKSVPISGPSPEEAIQREFKSGTKFINGDTLLARITPCLENGKTAFVDFLKDGEVGWGSTEFIVIRPKNISLSIGYFYARSYELRTHAINNMSGTSGRQRVPAECFNNFLIPSPEDYFLYEEFGRIAQAVLNSIRSNSDQSRTLAELRDTLLPKLLSGELSVSAAEDAMAAAES